MTTLQEEYNKLHKRARETTEEIRKGLDKAFGAKVAEEQIKRLKA